LTVTVLSEITINGTTTYTKTVTVTNKDGEPVGEPITKTVEKADFVPDSADIAGMDLTAGKKLIDLSLAYGVEVDLKISYSYQHEGIDEQNQPIGTYVITIENPGENLVAVKAILTDEGLAELNSGIKFVITDGTTETQIDSATKIVEIGGPNVANGDDTGDNGTDEPTT
jgi:hypothetical protein